MLEGFCAAHSDIVRLVDKRLVLRAQPKAPGKVGLVIGCGSGHEPAMTGWIGEGLFDVNIAGEIFAAPGPDLMVQGIRAAASGGGVLICVSHHAGDLLNAELALELCQAEGIEDVDMVVLYDDISSAPKGREPERRGTAGLFFVWKLLGAFCEGEGDLAAAKALAEKVRDNTRSLAMSLSLLRQSGHRRSHVRDGAGRDGNRHGLARRSRHGAAECPGRGRDHRLDAAAAAGRPAPSRPAMRCWCCSIIAAA